VIALSQLSHFALLLTSRTIPFKRLLNRIQQILIVERLSQKLYRTGLHGPDGHRDVSVGGNKYNWDLQPRVRQLPLKIKAVETGKPHIQNQAARAIPKASCQEFLSAAKRLRV